MTPRQKQIFSIFIKVSIVVFAFWFIYVKLIANNNLKKFAELVNSMPQTQIVGVMSIVVALMFANWGLESFKWKRIISKVEPINIWLAVKSVFCGLTWAVFTPNRIGEYGGRVFFLSPRKRIIGAIAMAVGNIGQLVLTNLFGPIMLCVFVYRFTAIDFRLFLVLCLVAGAFSSFFLLFFFNIKWLDKLLISIKYTRKFKKFYSVLAKYQKKELLKILLFCLARYIVFTTQYVIMFKWLAPEIHSLDVVMLVCVVFFVQSSLPSLDLFDVGVRSFTASYLFGFVTSNVAAVVAVTASIWLINLIIPAILGSYFVFKLKFFGNTHRT